MLFRSDIPIDIQIQLSCDALYESYIARQNLDVEAVKRDEAHVIPADFDYSVVSGLSSELRLKLTQSRPSNIAQAGKIEGMTPAALSLILSRITNSKRKKTA